MCIGRQDACVAPNLCSSSCGGVIVVASVQSCEDERGHIEPTQREGVLGLRTVCCHWCSHPSAAWRVERRRRVCCTDNDRFLHGVCGLPPCAQVLGVCSVCDTSIVDTSNKCVSLRPLLGCNGDNKSMHKFRYTRAVVRATFIHEHTAMIPIVCPALLGALGTLCGFPYALDIIMGAQTIAATLAILIEIIGCAPVW